jgi:S-adenosylmethionine uptake transporter
MEFVMSRRSQNLAGAGLGLAAFGAYACYDASAKFLGAGYHPLQIIFAAGTMCMPLLLLYVLLDPATGSLRPRRPGLMALRVAGTLVNFILGVWAFTLLPLAEAYAIFFTMPLFIALLAVPMLGEKIDLTRGLAVLFGLVGVIVALDPSRTTLGWGHAAALVGALVGAMNYVIVRKTGAVERTAVLLVWPLLVLFFVTAATMPFVYLPMPAADLGIAAFMAVALIAGVLLIIAAYRRAPAIVVAPMQYSQIGWAALLGALFFDEAIGLRLMLGMVLVAIAGFVVAATTEAERPAPDPAAAPVPPVSVQGGA